MKPIRYTDNRKTKQMKQAIITHKESYRGNTLLLNPTSNKSTAAHLLAPLIKVLASSLSKEYSSYYGIYRVRIYQRYLHRVWCVLENFGE